MKSSPSDPERSAWRLSAALVLPLLVIIPSVGLLAVVYAWTRRHDIPFGVLTRDPVAQSGLPFFAGYLSYLGAMLWCAAGAVCLLCAVVGPKRIGTRWFSFFLIAGTLSTVMAADDLMQLHEEFLPRMFGVREQGVLLGYALMVLLLVGGHIAIIRSTAVTLLMLAGACFVLTVSVDRGWIPVREAQRHLIEDGIKFVGIASWCAYFVHTCVTRLRRAIDAGGGG